MVTNNIYPVVFDEFIGCDVVLDDDQTLEEIHNGDDLENCDTVPTVIGNVEVDVAQSQTELVEPVTPATLAAHTDLELGLSMTDAQAAPAAPPAQAASIELTMQLVPQTLESQISPINVVDSIFAPQTMVTSPVNQKRRRGRSQDIVESHLAPVTTPSRPVVIGLSALATSQPALKSKAIVDEDGFTKVFYRKSPKLASRPAILKLLQ